MNVIIIPDIHGRDYWKKVNPECHDKIVFLGDYVDSWDISNEDTYNNLEEIINLKKQYPEKVKLLIGNHDLQYIFPMGDRRVACTGFRSEAYYDLHDLFHNNILLFKVAYQYKNYLFSHAGLSKGWYNYSALPQIIEIGCENLPIDTQLTKLYLFQKSSIFDVGWDRGGSARYGGGIFWADKRETFKKPLEGYHQVVGHSFINEPKTYIKDENTSITYCDCLNNKTMFKILNI